jgi:hypothetical protein
MQLKKEFGGSTAAEHPRNATRKPLFPCHFRPQRPICCKKGRPLAFENAGKVAVPRRALPGAATIPSIDKLRFMPYSGAIIPPPNRAVSVEFCI